MAKRGPIIWLEDDSEDQHLIEELIREIQPGRTLRIFSKGDDFLHYLRSTPEQPFIILSDINIPGLDGLQVRDEIMKDDFLREKSIPFIFFSTTADEFTVRKAYGLTVQGYFEKGNTYDEFKARLMKILDYWADAKHPNSFDNTTSRPGVRQQRNS